MAFFEELGELMKKYNFSIHTIQLDENVAKFNEVFKMNIKKEDLPPPVILFRTSEGDFVPTIFGPITINNEQQNMQFINVAEPSKIINIFPPKDPVVEETAKEVQKETQMEWEDVPKTEEKKTKKTSKKKSKKETTSSVQNKKILVVGPLFKGQNFNAEQYNKFVNDNLNKLSVYNTINTILSLVIGQKNYAQNEPIKANSKRGKEVINQLCESYVRDFGAIVLMKGWEKALEARKIKEFAEANNLTIVEQKDF